MFIQDSGHLFPFVLICRSSDFPPEWIDLGLIDLFHRLGQTLSLLVHSFGQNQFQHQSPVEFPANRIQAFQLIHLNLFRGFIQIRVEFPKQFDKPL